MSQFYLMNKDIRVLSFEISEKGITDISIKTIFKPDLIPLFLRVKGRSLESWLNSRLVLSHRKDITKMFRVLGVNSLSDVLLITKGISLTDTFWVKNVSSKDTWNTVSPFRNPLNPAIADYSFSESRTINGKHISSSPDFATSGSYPKCWRKVNNCIYLYKAGASGASNAGKEPYGEYFTSLLADRLGIPHVSYELVTYKERISTRCQTMCSEDIGLSSIYDLYDPNSINSYTDMLKLCKTSLDKECYVGMLLIDYLSLNVDRHLNNIGVLVDNNTQKCLGFSPTYDFNMSFLPYYVKGDCSIDDYIDPKNGHCLPMLQKSFDELFKIIDCQNIRDMLKKLRGFKFPSNIERSDIANYVLSVQLKKISV